MNMRFILDSNIWIAILRRQTIPINKLRESTLDGHDILVTAVEYFEVMRGLRLRGNLEAINYLNNLWATLTFCEADQKIWDAAIGLWVKAVKENQKREDSDILLAAFATCHRATIVTNNTKDFSFFEIELEDWTTPLRR